MTLKVNDNANFNLTLKQNMDFERGNIEFLVILDNKENHKRKMNVFKADDFRAALQKFKEYEQFIF